jgi:hypothetical protein
MRTRDSEREEAQARLAARLLAVLSYDLEDVFRFEGSRLLGFSVKLGTADCLITVRALREGVPQVAFVGGETMPNTLLKVVRDAKADNLRWRDDKYST